MRKLINGTAAVLTALSVMLSAASCAKINGGSKSNSGKKITGDMPWFDATFFNVDQGIDKDRKLSYSYSSFMGSDDKYMAFLTDGFYREPENIDPEEYDISDYTLLNVSVIDKSTKDTVRIIELNKELGSDGFVDSAMYKEGKIELTYVSFDADTWKNTYYAIQMDPVTGEVLNKQETGKRGAVRKSFKVGDYTVDAEANSNSDISFYNLIINSPDGNKKNTVVSDGNQNIFDISAIVPLSDTKALVIGMPEWGNAYYELDLVSGDLTEVDGQDYDWINLRDLYSSFNGDNGMVYYSTPSGISRINVAGKTTEEVFNYSWCGVNRNVMSNLSIVEMSDERFILCGEVYRFDPFMQLSGIWGSEFYIIEFTKAGKNPHAGKTILEMYSSHGYTDNWISDAISEFNSSNGDYYIEVTDRYRDSSYGNLNDVSSDDEMEMQWLEQNADMSSKMAMDIINGDGPDILMDVSSFNQLKSGDFLADLTPYIGDADPEKYFTNIIDASKIDGKLYNLPICFGISGIQTDRKYAGSSGIGFTTEEYSHFVKETLNGKDVITYGQPMYFAELFNSRMRDFIVNGKADFENSELEELAAFVKENVPEKSVSWEDENSGNSAYSIYAVFGYNVSETGLAMYNNCSSYYNYFRGIELLNGAEAILGTPSIDGSGPMGFYSSSISVSAQSASVEACGEFVKMLLTDRVQEKIAMEGGQFVLNREAFRKAGGAAVGYYNERGCVEFDEDHETGRPDPKNHHIFNAGQIEELEQMILSCKRMDSEDAAVNLILIEEMQPYFAGQKDLDQVLKIAQDRVQIVLDERG